MEIAEAIRKIAGHNKNVMAMVCEVVSTDAHTAVCSPIDGSADIEDVRIQVEESAGIYIIPRIGSKVVVAMMNDVEGYIALYSDIEAIEFLDGSFGGLIKISELVTKLNNLESKVNDLIAAYNAHVHTGVTTGAGSSAITPTQVTGTLTPTQQAELENLLVKHGTI